MPTPQLTPIPDKITAGEIGIINLATTGLTQAQRLKALVEDINDSYLVLECDSVPQIWITTLCDHPHHQFAAVFSRYKVEEKTPNDCGEFATYHCVGDNYTFHTQYLRTVEELEMYLTGHALALENAGLF